VAGRITPPTAIQRQENNPGDRGMYEFETNSGAKTTEAGKGDDGTGTIETRKGNTPIKVWVTPSEKKAIETSAMNCGMSTSAYLRQIGFGMPIKSILDQNSIADLAKVNADQGRLGGLLKLWLTNDEKLKSYDRAKLSVSITKLLGEIKRLQTVLFEKVTII
jgi:hypothetical protein